MDNTIPVLKCYPTENGQVKAWCPFCGKWHIHGYAKKITRSKIIGHRIGHCNNKNSPFHEKGYYLKLMSKKELSDIAESIKLYGNSLLSKII